MSTQGGVAEAAESLVNVRMAGSPTRQTLWARRRDERGQIGGAVRVAANVSAGTERVRWQREPPRFVLQRQRDHVYAAIEIENGSVEDKIVKLGVLDAARMRRP